MLLSEEHPGARSQACFSTSAFYRLLAALILLAAVVSRFAGLGERVMSHDEVNHVAPAYDYAQGLGYRYDPVTHGPLQFHLIAACYWLLGDSDFTSRIPAALFSVATVALGLFAFRRWLGLGGSLAAGVLLLISPYMLFYGRYARNEALIVVWGLLVLASILNYLESGSRRALAVFVLSNALHFTDKATAYIFAAEQLGFLGLYLLYRAWQRVRLAERGAAEAPGAESPPASPETPPAPRARLARLWAALRGERAFDLAVLLGTLMLPLLAALPIKLLGFDPLDTGATGMARSALAVGILALLAAALGGWWGGRRWFRYAALFYAPIFVLYTSFFSNGAGLAGGFLGALGYWSSQQAVERGGQPLYYYALLQIPVYEFLPALGALAAAAIGLRRGRWSAVTRRPREEAVDRSPAPALALFLYWSLTSLLAFTLAGERMPWLTIHIALPLILATAWTIGYWIERVDWPRARRQGAGWAALLAALALAALAGTLAGLADVRAGTGWYPAATVAAGATGFVIAAAALAWRLRRWGWPQARRFFSLLTLAALAALTARAAFRAAFVLYDYPFEYLVYAHAAPDPKIVLAQVEELALRSGQGRDLVVAYDRETRYPYWWYLRHYKNRVDYGESPSRDLRRAAVILAGDSYYAGLEPVVGAGYWQWDYQRLWWPNQDYWNLKWERVAAASGQKTLTPGGYLAGAWARVRPFFTDPEVRAAVWQIWYNRDFTAWAALKNSAEFSDRNWRPARSMRLYVRKDVAYRAWKMGADEPLPFPPDLYQAVLAPRQPARVLGSHFTQPRGLALAPDGSLYVADAGAHRILHFSAAGAALHAWGSFADIGQGAAPGGTFNAPWDVAVGPDGAVYVADTWNGRVQKFTAAGVFVRAWGRLGQGPSPENLWGPRGVAVDGQGRVYVADTGNKRVLVFDADGGYLAQFGGAGSGAGQMEEPVGVAVGPQGRVYVADTWNRRVQVFAPAGENTFAFERTWAVAGWYGQSAENKPFIAVNERGEVLITDPEGPRVIVFDSLGNPLRAWSRFESGGFGRPVGLAVDSSGGVWVSDGVNRRIDYFGGE